MKKVIKLAFVAVAGYGVYTNQTSGAMSDLALVVSFQNWRID